MLESRNATIATINRLCIPKIMLAAAVQLDSSRISDYTKHRPLPAERVEAIESAVKKIEFVWNTYSPFRITLDSPELLERAFREAQDTVEFRTLAGELSEPSFWAFGAARQQ